MRKSASVTDAVNYTVLATFPEFNRTIEDTVELRTNLVLALRASGASDCLTLLSIDRLTRHVRVFGKFFRRLQQLKPDRFVQLPTGY
jgi:hypothetical protein